jgi:hypothetical protein
VTTIVAAVLVLAALIGCLVWFTANTARKVEAAVPVANSIRWRLIENRAMLPLDVGFVQTDLWDGDRSATVARNARGRGCGAEAANQCAAACH